MTVTNDANEGQPTSTRCIDCNRVPLFESFHWLALALKDFKRSPLICLGYGLVFSIVPAAILYLAYETHNFFVIFPASIAYALIGPVFAIGLYDVAWELEKGRKPTFRHSWHSMFRNPVSEWGFAILLMVLMIIWMRIASIVYALYPSHSDPTLEELLAFLCIGTGLGAILATAVFTISAFTPQIVMERKVDIITAVISSINAVKQNAGAMMVWGACIFVLVLLGFLTGALGFIIIMPILSLASWHAYIAVIKTKIKRNYE
jgi:uncharacterized membrane protein